MSARGKTVGWWEGANGSLCAQTLKSPLYSPKRLQVSYLRQCLFRHIRRMRSSTIGCDPRGPRGAPLIIQPGIAAHLKPDHALSTPSSGTPIWRRGRPIYIFPRQTVRFKTFMTSCGMTALFTKVIRLVMCSRLEKRPVGRTRGYLWSLKDESKTLLRQSLTLLQHENGFHEMWPGHSHILSLMWYFNWKLSEMMMNLDGYLA